MQPLYGMHSGLPYRSAEKNTYRNARRLGYLTPIIIPVSSGRPEGLIVRIPLTGPISVCYKIHVPPGERGGHIAGLVRLLFVEVSGVERPFLFRSGRRHPCIRGATYYE